MKIRELNLSGFRSLKQVKWEPGDLNLLIGPNASGKSNLLRSLELISAAGTGRLASFVKEAGGMGAICWDNQKTAAVSFRLKTSPVKPDGDEQTESLTYQVELSRIGEGANFQVNSELLAHYCAQEKKHALSPLKFLERRRAVAHVFDETKTEGGKSKGLVRVPDDALQDEETVLSVAGNPIVASLLRNRFLNAYQRELAAWSVYHAFGSHPESIVRQPRVVRHEARVSPDGSNLVSVLQTLYNSTRDFRERSDGVGPGRKLKRTLGRNTSASFFSCMSWKLCSLVTRKSFRKKSRTISRLSPKSPKRSISASHPKRGWMRYTPVACSEAINHA